MPSVAFCCASAFAWHSRSSRAIASASALPVLVPRPPAFALSGRRDVHPHVRPRARSWAPLHSPCLSTSASTTTSATSSPPPRASTSGRTWQGHIWNLRSHRTKVHLRQSCRTRLGLQRQGLAVYLGPDEEMMATAKFFSAATPKFRGDFVVQKVSQEDAAFILAWLSDPSASKRAHSAVDLTADGLDFGTRPANCINDMRSHQEPALVPISWCFIAAAGLQLHVQLGLRLFFVCLPHS